MEARGVLRPSGGIPPGNRRAEADYQQQYRNLRAVTGPAEAGYMPRLYGHPAEQWPDEMARAGQRVLSDLSLVVCPATNIQADEPPAPNASEQRTCLELMKNIFLIGPALRVAGIFWGTNKSALVGDGIKRMLIQGALSYLAGEGRAAVEYAALLGLWTSVYDRFYPATQNLDAIRSAAMVAGGVIGLGFGQPVLGMYIGDAFARTTNRRWLMRQADRIFSGHSVTMKTIIMHVTALHISPLNAATTSGLLLAAGSSVHGHVEWRDNPERMKKLFTGSAIVFGAGVVLDYFVGSRFISVAITLMTSVYITTPCSLLQNLYIANGFNTERLVGLGRNFIPNIPGSRAGNRRSRPDNASVQPRGHRSNSLPPQPVATTHTVAGQPARPDSNQPPADRREHTPGPSRPEAAPQTHAGSPQPSVLNLTEPQHPPGSLSRQVSVPRAAVTARPSPVPAPPAAIVAAATAPVCQKYIPQTRQEAEAAYDKNRNRWLYRWKN